MPYSRQTSLTRRPPSTSFRILTICDSLYRDFFMSFSVSVIVGRRTLITHAPILGDGYSFHVMRMRYAKADPQCDEALQPCLRNRPISAWISSDVEGNPVLSATVDLYVDAP